MQEGYNGRTCIALIMWSQDLAVYHAIMDHSFDLLAPSNGVVEPHQILDVSKN